MSDNFIQENADIITLRAMANVFMPEALDPVGQEDDDVDNDGDSDKSDEYLKKRRKAVGSAIDKRKKKLKETAMSQLPQKSRAAAHTSDEDDEEITEKKVKNKVVINPEMKESKDYDPMEDDEFDHDEAEENRGVSGKNNPKGGKRLYKKREVKKEEVEQIDEGLPLVAAGLAAAAAAPYLMKKFGKPAADKALDNATKNSNLPLATGGGTADLRRAKQAAGMQVNSYEPEGEVIDERRKEEKVEGTPRNDIGKTDLAYRSVKKIIRDMSGGRPAGQRKKEPGKKPPTAGQYGAPKSPAQKVAMRRAAAQRSQDNMSSRFD